jgi:hypothetical protein
MVYCLAFLGGMTERKNGKIQVKTKIKKGYRAIIHRKKKHSFGHVAKQCRFGALAFVFVLKLHHFVNNALFRFNRFFMFKNRFLKFYGFLNFVLEFLTFDQFKPNSFLFYPLLH